MSRHVARRRTPKHTIGLRHAMTSLKLRAVLTAGLLLGVGATATGAFWTQSVSVPATSFTAGTIDLQLNDQASGNYPFTSLALADMLPGNSYAATVTVQNKAQAKLRFTMDARAAGTLGSSLNVTLYWGGTATNSGFTGTCSGTAVGPASTLSASDQTLITSAVTDARPAISGGGSQVLCVLVSLPTTASASLAGQSTAATFTFRAKSVQG